DGIRDFHVTGVQTCALPIWVLGLQGRDQLLAGRRVRRRRDLRVPRREPFLLLQLHPLPRRVAQHHVEAAAPAALLVFCVSWVVEIGRASCREREAMLMMAGC